MSATAFLFELVIVVPLMFFFYNLGKAKGRAEERARRPKTPKAVCPCEHVWGQHEEGGECHGQVRRAHYSSIGTRNGYEWVPCGCKKYHGPVPITDNFFHPGFTTPPEINS